MGNINQTAKDSYYNIPDDANIFAISDNPTTKSNDNDNYEIKNIHVKRFSIIRNTENNKYIVLLGEGHGLKDYVLMNKILHTIKYKVSEVSNEFEDVRLNSILLSEIPSKRAGEIREIKTPSSLVYNFMSYNENINNKCELLDDIRLFNHYISNSITNAVKTGYKLNHEKDIKDILELIMEKFNQICVYLYSIVNSNVLPTTNEYIDGFYDEIIEYCKLISLFNITYVDDNKHDIHIKKGILDLFTIMFANKTIISKYIDFYKVQLADNISNISKVGINSVYHVYQLFFAPLCLLLDLHIIGTLEIQNKKFTFINAGASHTNAIKNFYMHQNESSENAKYNYIYDDNVINYRENSTTLGKLAKLYKYPSTIAMLNLYRAKVDNILSDNSNKTDELERYINYIDSIKQEYVENIRDNKQNPDDRKIFFDPLAMVPLDSFYIAISNEKIGIPSEHMYYYKKDFRYSVIMSHLNILNYSWPEFKYLNNIISELSVYNENGDYNERYEENFNIYYLEKIREYESIVVNKDNVILELSKLIFIEMLGKIYLGKDTNLYVFIKYLTDNCNKFSKLLSVENNKIKLNTFRLSDFLLTLESCNLPYASIDNNLKNMIIMGGNEESFKITSLLFWLCIITLLLVLLLIYKMWCYTKYIWNGCSESLEYVN
jgi:hypothetical protein